MLKIEAQQDGKLKFYYSSESNGRHIRLEESNMRETLPDHCTCETHPHVSMNGKVEQRPITQEELFYAQRLKEYRICRRYYDGKHKMLAIFVKRDNMHKAMVAITVSTDKGTAWFNVSGTKLVPYKVFDGKISNAVIRKTLGIGKDLKCYAQSVSEVIRAFEHKHNDSHMTYGLKDARPTDRHPQTFMLKGKPLQSVERATRQDNPLHARPYDMVAKSHMLRFSN